jgi:2-keto-4-pentenoate hydratase/2-oxohepta-3-ene-1,7-dioic acid hydratase in catechol pathway
MPIERFVRYQAAQAIAYGSLDGETVHELDGDLFSGRRNGVTHNLRAVKLLAPCEPSTILAVGRNYGSHLGQRNRPSRPDMFFLPPTAIQHPGEPIVIPQDATDVHYEGELVIVIGTTAKNASPEAARECIFGVTCGNDVSERQWQHGPDKDLQWWRAKGSDTFAPLGPCIARGLNYDNLLLRTRLNGDTVQEQSTSDLLFDCPTVVSWVSRYVTLRPGDVIYTGTPGTTKAMKPGNVVEVEIEGIGILSNPVTGAGNANAAA